MKILIKSLIIQLVLLGFIGHAQDNTVTMNKEVRQLIELGKDSIMLRALALIDEEVSIENFTHTYFQTNGEEVIVSLFNPIKYLPMNSIFYFDVHVNLTKETVTKDSWANPRTYQSKAAIPFYKPTAAIDKHLQFIIEAIDTMDMHDLDNFEDFMMIREHETYYETEVISETQESYYKIKKVSGELYDEMHGHIVQNPIKSDKKEVFKEIDFTKNE